MAVKSNDPERDPATGKWIKLDYFQLQPDGEFQLYNLKDDPAEERDLNKEHPEKVRELQKLLNLHRNSGRSTP